MNINELIISLIKLKNEGGEEVTIDPEKSKVCDKYGYLNLRDSKGNLIKMIRLIRK